MCVLHVYDGSTPRPQPKAFLEKPGIKPATPCLQGIAIIHYNTAASMHKIK